MSDDDQAKNNVGSPTIYTEQLADEICERLSEGQSLRRVCLSDLMPDKSTVFRWLRTKQEFCDQYTRAKRESADALVDEMLDIADDSHNDWMEKFTEEEGKSDQLNPENIQRARLRIETRKWISARMQPKKYGERIEQTITALAALTDLSLEELNRRIQENELAIQRSTQD